MRLDFKKGLSFVLALVMAVGTLTMVNVSSVMAAGDYDKGDYSASGNTATWDFTNVTEAVSGIPDKAPIYNMIVDLSANASKAKVNITASKSDSPGNLELANQAAIKVPVATATSGKVTITCGAGKKGNFLQLGSDSSNKIEQTKNVELKLSFTEDDVSGGYITLVAASNFKFKTLTVELTDGTFSTGSYTWNLVKDNLQSLVSDGFKLDSLRVAKSPTDTVYNTLIYDDPGYSIVRSQVTLKEGLQDDNGVTVVTKEGDAFTVTPTPAMFMKNVSFDAKKIRVKNAAKKILHLTCKHGTVYSLKLSDTADEESYYPVEGIIKGHNENGGYEVDKENLVLPAHADEFTVTMGGGTLNDGVNPAGASKFTLKDASSEYKADFTPYTLEPINSNISETKFTDLLTSSDSRGERILGGTVIDEGHHFFVLGADYNNTYKLSGLANTEDFGTGTQAIVIRSHNVDEETGNEEGGIGFTLEEETGYTYTVAINCVAVRDRESTGLENTSIGIGEYNKETYAFTDTDTIPEQTITKTIDPFNNPETDDYKTSEIKRFTGLKPGKTYGIYNPGAKDEQGNIRIYSISVTKVPDTLEPVPDPSDKYVAEGTHKFGSGIDLFKQAFNSKQDFTFEYDNFTFHGSTTLDQERDNVKFRKGDTIKFKVKNAATLSMVLASGSKDVTVSGDNDTVTFTSSNYSTQTMKLKPDVQYTIDAVSENSNSKIVSITITPDGPSIPTITGTVTLSDKYEYIPPTGVTDKNEPTASDNVVMVEPDSSNNRVKTVKKDINTLKVTAKDADGNAVADDEIQILGSTFTIGVKDGLTADKDYKITVEADGTKSKEITVHTGDSAVEENVDLTTPQYTVRFVTNIKNFKDNSKALPEIQTSDGKSLFQLDDKTYYTEDKDNDDLSSVNSSASTTHTMKMPAGSYKYVYTDDSGTYKLSQDSSGKDTDNMAFTIEGNGRKSIYFIPQLSVLAADDVTNKVNENKDSIINNVVIGTYTFATPNSSSSAQDMAITYTGEASEGNDGKQLGMLAYGVQGTGEKSSDYFGLTKNHGAVIFRLDRPMLAHITTEQKACALYNVDYVPGARAADSAENSINGAFGLIPIDSSYFTRTISLAKGTYALVSLTDDTEKPAKVTSIEFKEGSPFEVLSGADIVDYNDGETTGKMIIGTYNADNDDLIGTTSAESYSLFAILVAADANALSVNNIDNIVNSDTFNPNGTATAKKSESGGDDDYSPQVNEMTVGKDTTYTVLIDATDKIFSTIVGDKGNVIKEKSADEGGNKYYATIVEKLQGGGTTYYAAGAAKINGSTAEDNKETWLVQSSPVSFTVD